MRWILVAVASAACSGRGATKPRVVEDAPAVAKPVVPAGPYKVDATFDKGDVQIRVEWKDVPVEARASAGRTACGTAKPAAVAPTTTWGIPDVVVMIDANHGKAMPASGSASGSGSGSGSTTRIGESRIVLERCALSPRVAIVESPLIIASAMEAPAKLTLAKLAPARPLVAPAAPTPQGTTIQLPIAGHEAALALDTDSITELRSDDDYAIAVVAPTPYYAITEANGQVILRDVPIGTFDIAAWLPARAGRSARTARGKVTVTAGTLAEVTLTL
ncbi:MAG: hypothetical protein ABJE66_25570 [Deltaproteobacteria bacterium]